MPAHLAVPSWLWCDGATYSLLRGGVLALVAYYLSGGWRPGWGDGDSEFVDGVEGAGVVVVVGGLPWAGRLGGCDVVDVVDEEVPPSLPGIGGECSGGGLSAGLVAEQHGSAVFPAEGVGADEAVFAVGGDADGAAWA